MEKLLSERRGSTRISFASQPTIMLANAEQGSFSATLVDLCADGMCLNTDAPFSPGTQVKAYFPDHRGPSVKARVVRNWSGGMALIVSGSATRRLRYFISRLMCHEQHAKPIILNRAASGSAHPAWGLTMMATGFLAAMLALMLLNSPSAAGLSGMIAMAATLIGGALMNQCKLDNWVVRQAILLGTVMTLMGLVFKGEASSASAVTSWPWLTAIVIIGLYMITRTIEAYIGIKRTPEADV